MVAAIGLVAGCSSCDSRGTAPGPIAPAVPGVDDLGPLLEPIRAQYDLPGLAAAVLDGSSVVALGASGVRKNGDGTGVTADDKWHLGSDTKAMTATLVALFVEGGELTWTMTLADLFGADGVHPGYRAVTIEQLLAHRGGAPGAVPSDIWSEMWKPGVARDQRLAAVRAMLARPPAVAPGTYTYANAGYMIVGAALELKADRSWEQLMRERVFTPLGMSSCGFGAPATPPDQIDQPWAHQVDGRAVVPVPPGPKSDNPPALGPAGTVPCNLRDWGRFLQLHLRGDRGEPGLLLSPATFTKLHTPWAGGDYALGWIVTEQPWADGRALTHSGTNTMFFATTWIAPNRNRILVAATNRGDDRGADGVDAAFGPLIEKYLAKR
jgi:D-alanyl-D-alanine carboxypeptidase